jgi:hypothetical protein
MPTVPFEKWLQSSPASGDAPEVDEDLATLACSMKEKARRASKP